MHISSSRSERFGADNSSPISGSVHPVLLFHVEENTVPYAQDDEKINEDATQSWTWLKLRPDTTLTIKEIHDRPYPTLGYASVSRLMPLSIFWQLAINEKSLVGVRPCRVTEYWFTGCSAEVFHFMSSSCYHTISSSSRLDAVSWQAILL